MGALSGGANGGLWWYGDAFNIRRKRRSGRDRRRKASSESADTRGTTGSTGFRFPLKQALTAGSLALAGDTIAQLTQRLRALKNGEQSIIYSDESDKDVIRTIFADHDWLRALRMTSYGFLFYGPGSYMWYQCLDHHLPEQTVKNLMLKVLFNQIILGPCVIAVVFAWNNLWQGKLSELPRKYQNDAISTLFYGFRFWVPYSTLNFWVVPLQARVAFMSFGSIFWNFVLSSTMSK